MKVGDLFIPISMTPRKDNGDNYAYKSIWKVLSVLEGEENVWARDIKALNKEKEGFYHTGDCKEAGWYMHKEDCIFTIQDLIKHENTLHKIPIPILKIFLKEHAKSVL